MKNTETGAHYRVHVPLEILLGRLSIQEWYSAFDASSFSPPSRLPSCYSSYSSKESATSSVSDTSTSPRGEAGISKGKVGALSRSRCMNDLSALGGHASETSISRQTKHASFPISYPNQCWGYFVDTPDNQAITNTFFSSRSKERSDP